MSVKSGLFQISAATVKKVIKYQFIELVLADQNETNFDALFSNKLLSRSASYLVKNKLETRQYAIPCNITHNKEVNSFNIGPVVFFKSEYWLEQNKHLFEIEGQFKELYSTSLETFKNHTWVATVEIEKTDEFIGLERARHAIVCAINVIRLFTSREVGHHFGMTTQKLKPSQSAYFIQKSGSPSPVIQRTFQPMFPEELWKEFVGREDSFVSLAGSSIVQITNDVDQFMLLQRFLDALYWYGDAVQEENGGALITKCTAALERLTITKRNPEGIKRLVSTRGAFLASKLTDVNADEIKTNIEQLYETRSRLMHGGISPFRFDENFGEHTALHTVNRVLFGALYFYWTLKQGKATDKDLEAAFKAGTEPW